MAVRIRPADAADAAFLQRMLVVADSWREHSVPAVDPVKHAEVWHYVADWPRDHDVGVIAEDDGPVGAAWARVFPPDRPGYGFIDATTPEIAIAVEPTHQGQGIGRRLLTALIDQARQRRVAQLSLNVEADNHGAQRLYLSTGFVIVEQLQDSCTMLLPLDA